MKVNQLLVMLAAMMLVLPVLAADSPPDLADTWIVVVKDGHDEEFREAFKDHLKYRLRKKDKRAWQTYAPHVGDDLNFYAIRSCCSTYAEMDEYQAWSDKAKAGDHWNQNVDPHIAEYSHYFSRVDLANSNWPEKDPGFSLFGVTYWDEKQGHGAAIGKSKAALSKAAKAGGWPRYWSWANAIGGDGSLMLVTPYMNFADIEGPKGGFAAFLAQQVGEEKAGEMLADFSSNFHGSSYTLYRRIDDMSMKE